MKSCTKHKEKSKIGNIFSCFLEDMDTYYDALLPFQPQSQRNDSLFCVRSVNEGSSARFKSGAYLSHAICQRIFVDNLSRNERVC